MQSRLDILKIHSRKMNLMRGIDLKKIAEKMGGASGAELKVITGPIMLLFCSSKKTVSQISAGVWYQAVRSNCFWMIVALWDLVIWLFIDHKWFLSGCMHRSRHVCST